MHQHGLNWKRSKPCLAGVMESRCSLRWLSGFGGPGGKNMIRSACLDVLCCVSIHESWVRGEGKVKTHRKQKGSEEEKEGKKKRAQREDGVEAPAEGTSTKDEGSGTGIFLLTSLLRETFAKEIGIFLFFPAKPKAKLPLHGVCIINCDF